jgi:hypothetical protein
MEAVFTNLTQSKMRQLVKNSFTKTKSKPVLYNSLKE